jgi:hypothetical protein
LRSASVFAFIRSSVTTASVGWVKGIMPITHQHRYSLSQP